MSPKPDENSLYEQQENKILAQSDAFISLLTKRGILGDHEIDNARVRNAQQKRRRTAFHNTQVLLQHYRSFKWILEMMPESILHHPKRSGHNNVIPVIAFFQFYVYKAEQIR